MRVYMDYNASTPLKGEVLEVMIPVLREQFANPSSPHSPGRRLREAIEEARVRVAEAIGARAEEVIFTSGGTEANNLALLGVAKSPSSRRKIVLSAIEHPSVLEVAKDLKRQGFEVVELPVTPEGVVDLEAASSLIDEATLLVSVMVANHEIGTLQPVKEIAAMAKRVGALLHSDAAIAFGKVPVRVEELGVDLLSLSAHKAYGPKGAGALYVRKGVRLRPVFYGGHHERRLRPGTENPAAIVGFGRAATLAVEDLASGVWDKVARLRDRLQERLLEEIPYSIVNGTGPRLPNTLNMSFAFVEGEAMCLMLDARGLALSTGSACASGNLEPSHVLLALGLPPELTHGSLRFSLGLETTEEEVEWAVLQVKEVVEQLRAMSPLYDDRELRESGLSLTEYIAKKRQQVQWKTSPTAKRSSSTS